MRDRKIAIVDVETTGSRTSHDRIIEIGIVRFLNGEIVDSFSSLVDPRRPLKPFISYLTGIHDRELIVAPTFYDIADRVQQMLQDATFIAHNVRFDYGFVRSEFMRLGIHFETDRLCSVRLSRALYPHFRRHSLTALIDRYGFHCENRHRALDDALIVAEFLEHIEQDLPEQQINEIFSTLLQRRPVRMYNFSPSVELSV